MKIIRVANKDLGRERPLGDEFEIKASARVIGIEEVGEPGQELVMLVLRLHNVRIVTSGASLLDEQTAGAFQDAWRAATRDVGSATDAS